MAISKNDVLKVAHLARINLSEDELGLFSKQLESVLDFIDKLKKLDVSSVSPTSHVLDVKNIVRPDTPKKSLEKDNVLKNSPKSLKDHFQVPRVVE